MHCSTYVCTQWAFQTDRYTGKALEAIGCRGCAYRLKFLLECVTNFAANELGRLNPSFLATIFNISIVCACQHRLSLVQAFITSLLLYRVKTNMNINSNLPYSGHRNVWLEYVHLWNSCIKDVRTTSMHMVQTRSQQRLFAFCSAAMNQFNPRSEGVPCTHSYDNQALKRRHFWTIQFTNKFMTDVVLQITRHK